jgi:hypothetical protein
MKKLIFVGLVALSGCDSKNSINGSPDMAQSSSTCFTGTPMTNEDFLNACSTASSVDITPTYPDNAPNGVLPPLN